MTIIRDQKMAYLPGHLPKQCDCYSMCCYQQELSCWPCLQSGTHNPTMTSPWGEERYIVKEICSGLHWRRRRRRRRRELLVPPPPPNELHDFSMWYRPCIVISILSQPEICFSEVIQDVPAPVKKDKISYHKNTIERPKPESREQHLLSIFQFYHTKTQ